MSTRTALAPPPCLRGGGKRLAHAARPTLHVPHACIMLTCASPTGSHAQGQADRGGRERPPPRAPACTPAHAVHMDHAHTPPPQVTSTVFFDIEIGGEAAGRIEFALCGF